MKVFTRVSLISFLALGLLVSPAPAAILNFEANFDGLQEVPPNASPAIGFADITLDTLTGALTVTNGTYSDLLGGSTVVVIGNAAAGANGTIFASLTLDTPGSTTGTFSGTT